MREQDQNHSPETSALLAKYRKQLFLTTVSAVVSIGVIIGATAAWFASNRRVDSTGMTARVQTTSNLIISDSLQNLSIHASAPDKVTFTRAASSLVPCRHILSTDSLPSRGANSEDTHFSTSPTGLYYNTNPQDVDMDEGLGVTDATLYFSPVPIPSSDSALRFYMDFLVYIASAGGNITTTDFTVSMSAQRAGENPPAPPSYFKAASVDVYIAASSLFPNAAPSAAKQTISDNGTTYVYAGTVNAANQDWQGTAANALNSISLLQSGESLLFPEVESANNTKGVPVLLRCYFDGGLKKTDSKTYINSTETTEWADCVMSLTFVAADENAG